MMSWFDKERHTGCSDEEGGHECPPHQGPLLVGQAFLPTRAFESPLQPG